MRVRENKHAPSFFGFCVRGHVALSFQVAKAAKNIGGLRTRTQLALCLLVAAKNKAQNLEVI